MNPINSTPPTIYTIEDHGGGGGGGGGGVDGAGTLVNLKTAVKKRKLSQQEAFGVHNFNVKQEPRNDNIYLDILVSAHLHNSWPLDCG